MANYTPITTFASKDALATGSPSKVIYGADVDAEFAAIQTAIATKLDDAGTDTSTLGTVTATTSGTSHDITGISADAKEVTITFWGVSCSGSGQIYLQIGDSGGIENTGYVSSCGEIYDTNQADVDGTDTTSWPLSPTSGAARGLYGSVTLSLHALGSNRWVISGVLGSASGVVQFVTGGKSLSGTLDRIRLSCNIALGNAFDAGAINTLVKY